MSLFEEISKDLKGCSIPKQFAAPIEPIEVISTVSAEDAMRMNHEFQEACDLLQAEDCQSLSVMDEIVAGGPVMKKSLRNNVIK